MMSWVCSVKPSYDSSSFMPTWKGMRELLSNKSSSRFFAFTFTSVTEYSTVYNAITNFVTFIPYFMAIFLRCPGEIQNLLRMLDGFHMAKWLFEIFG